MEMQNNSLDGDGALEYFFQLLWSKEMVFGACNFRLTKA
jgi:hypothetical protein